MTHLQIETLLVEQRIKYNLINLKDVKSLAVDVAGVHLFMKDGGYRRLPILVER